MGAWSAAAGAGFASGALIGGALTEYANWRWTLIINVPIGVAGMLAARRILPEVTQPKRPRLDVLGALLATAGLLSIVYGTVNSGPDGWSAAATWGPIAAGAALICWFIMHEAVVDQPLLPMSLLKSRPIATANATMFLLSAAVYPSMFILSLYAQNVLHYSPFKTGLVFLAPTIVMAIASKYAAAVMRRTGSRPLLIIAAPVSAAGLAWLSRAGVDSSLVGSVLAPATVTFLGLGLANPPLAMAATAGAPPGQAGLASGIVNTTRQLGITIGLAIIVTVAVDKTRSSAAVGPLRALANGYDVALVVAAVFAFVALATALAFPRAARPALVQKKSPEPTFD
jgi:MFS family permease